MEKEIKRLQSDIELMRKLSTIDGFINEFLSELKNHDTFSAAFWKVNEEHLRLYGRYKYVDYKTFNQAYSRRHKKK